MLRSPTKQRLRRLLPSRRAKQTSEHRPIRTCVGCRRRAPAAELWRAALRGDGTVVLDRNGSGRGAWLCAVSTACFNEAVRRRAFGRAFRRSVEPAGLLSLASAFGAGSANVRESRVVGTVPVPSHPRKG